MKTVKDVEDEI
jgi:hypothetical protein